MYLRHTTVTRNGKSHTYWRLVRSVRTGNRVRQQTVAQLGELDAAGRVRARALAEAIVGIERQPGLFDDAGPTEPVTVDLRGFRLERGRRFGDVWLGLRLWQALGLDTLLHELLPAGREAVPWAQMAAVLVLARFCEPSSELHIAEDWFRRTALGSLILGGVRHGDRRAIEQVDVPTLPQPPRVHVGFQGLFPTPRLAPRPVHVALHLLGRLRSDWGPPVAGMANRRP
jgi:hypothetical protein